MWKKICLYFSQRCACCSAQWGARASVCTVITTSGPVCIWALNVQTYIVNTTIILSLNLILCLHLYDCIRDHIRLESARMSSLVPLCSEKIVNTDNVARFNGIHSWIPNYSTEHAIVKWTPTVISFLLSLCHAYVIISNILWVVIPHPYRCINIGLAKNR